MNAYDQDSSFWHTYTQNRPQIPDSFFERILRYHTDHGGDLNIVHDAGAGPALHSKRLARFFGKVLVTDVSDENVRIAAHRLNDDSQYEILKTSLEDTINMPHASVDMVFAASMLHWTNLDESIRAVHHQLKPGGTFAAFCVGYAALLNPEAQSIWLKLFQAGIEQYYSTIDRSRIRMNAITAASAYDVVRIDEKLFDPGAIRIKLNYPEGWSFYPYIVPPRYEADFPTLTNIGSNDVQISESDTNWTFNSDIQGLKSIFATFPFHKENEFLELWHELQEVIGNDDILAVWPVSLILATKS